MMRPDASLHADQAGRQVGDPRFYLPTRPLLPQHYRAMLVVPTTWNEFLQISMPITAIAVSSFADMACSLGSAPLASLSGGGGRSTAGPFHYRTWAANFRCHAQHTHDLTMW